MIRIFAVKKAPRGAFSLLGELFPGLGEGRGEGVAHGAADG